MNPPPRNAAARDADVLLIGGGVASVRCARTLRRRGFGGSILLVGDEATLPYNRPPLSKEVLRDEVDFALVAAEPASWYARQRVDLLTDARVVSLDPEARLATLADGTAIRFGQCLLATGAAPRRPPLAGAEEQVRTLRTIQEARAIRAAAQPGSRARIVGGGFIGVEVAASLAALGVHVTLFEMASALWSGTLGTRISTWAAETLRSAGVEVRLEERLTSLEPFAADLVVAGVGVEPRVELATAAGLDVGDGILTDQRHRTSAPGIFAAGDVARVAGRRVEHWHAAREGGEAAALAMLGEPPPEPRAPWVYSEFAGHVLDVVGWAPSFEEEVSLADGGAVAHLVGGRVAQIAVIDSALPVDAARALVISRPSLAEVEALAMA